MIKAILFDLDGTIINSEEGITKCVQYALKSFGIDEPDLKKLLCFIGPPLEPVFREKYGFDKDKAWQAVLKYRERFDKTGIFECELYGIYSGWKYQHQTAGVRGAWQTNGAYADHKRPDVPDRRH